MSTLAATGTAKEMTLDDSFATLARNYEHLKIGDAFISTVEYAFLSTMWNSREEFSEEKLHSVILKVMLKETHFNAELVGNIYKEVTRHNIDTKSILNFNSVFDARRAKNQNFNSYFSNQMERVNKAKEKIKNGEEVTDDECQQAKGVIIIPGSIEFPIDKGKGIDKVHQFGSIGAFFKKIWKGIEVGSVVLGLSNLWPGLTALVGTILCLLFDFALPLSIAFGAVSAGFMVASVVLPRKQITLRHWSMYFLGAMAAVILGWGIGLLIGGQGGTKPYDTPVPVTDTSIITHTPTITPTPSPVPTAYIASGLIYFNGEISPRRDNTTADVYTGPGEDYYRVENSIVSFKGKIGTAGCENGWYLIWYDSVINRKTKQRKIGWTKALTSDEESKPIPTLNFEYINTYVTSDCQMTDGKDFYGNLKKGDSVIYLCRIKSDEIVKGTDKMCYIEAEIEGVKRRGLVPYNCLPWKSKE